VNERFNARGRGILTSAVALLVAASASHGQATSGVPNSPHQIHIELVQGVRDLVSAGGPRAGMASDYIKYATDLVSNIDALDESVAPDMKLHDVEPLGFTGLAGLKAFRRQRNAAFVYDRAVITAVRFPAPEIIEVDLCTERTDANSRSRRTIVIHARNRWVDHKLLERWDRLEEIPAGASCGTGDTK
jgi:hypothetical protein